MRKLKILYVTQYFTGEHGATTNRAVANIRHFVQQGHDVTVIAEMPNHPKGIIAKPYRGKLIVKEKAVGASVIRVWVYTKPEKTQITRILFYVSFMFMGVIAALLNWKKFDVVYVTSPPLLVGGIGVALKFLFPYTRFVFEVRDLWPKTAIELGMLSNPQVISISRKLEMLCY
ncbi:MAG: glycosyltransferase WbuB, partial [Candidatus Cloacimonetes bacterium]|nr:glycosyltransferase WbuB [Candidatus Cloacimonadota bacterium]